MKKILMNYVGAGIIGVASLFSPANADSLKIDFLTNILNQTPACVQDTYNAHYDSDNGSISNGYDANDIKQGTSTDNDFVQMYSVDTGYVLTEDYRVFDPCDADSSVVYPIELLATESSWTGFTGTNRLEVDRSDVNSIPSNFDAYLFRYDRNDVLQQTYNLRDANDYTDAGEGYIEWEVSNALGKFGGLDLIIAKGNIADLNTDGFVNFVDYSIFANDWMKTEADLNGDLDSDGDCDMNDLADFVENWLWEIGE